MVAQFAAKTTNSEKAICFLSLMFCSTNKLKCHMLFTWKNFTRKKKICSRTSHPAPPFSTALILSRPWKDDIDLTRKLDGKVVFYAVTPLVTVTLVTSTSTNQMNEILLSSINKRNMPISSPFENAHYRKHSRIRNFLMSINFDV